MKKNIWIWNHYATNTYYEKGGRHYWFAKNLIKKGYNVTIFCANTIHNSEKFIDTDEKLYTIKTIENIDYIFIKTCIALGNGIDRIKNMILFYKNILKVSNKLIKHNLRDKPDIILASSVHPLTMLAGIQISRKINVPCICEIRDLWPESIVDYSSKLNKNSLIIKILYSLEKYIYMNADKLIFTMEGGIEYIKDKGWDRLIDISKIYHINNGIDLERFYENREKFILKDEDLESDLFKVIYAGSIRNANNIEKLIKCAEGIKNINKIKFIIYGEGIERQRLEAYCKNNNINNVVFKGKVDKKYIPYILSKSNLNILNYKKVDVWKYGGSQNKLFEYLASGKPICCNINMGYSLIKKYNCGIEKNVNSEQDYIDMIEHIYSLDNEKYEEMCKNAINISKVYDFRNLTNKLVDIIEKV